jgi:hypothetical protein
VWDANANNDCVITNNGNTTIFTVRNLTISANWNHLLEITANNSLQAVGPTDLIDNFSSTLHGALQIDTGAISGGWLEIYGPSATVTINNCKITSDTAQNFLGNILIGHGDTLQFGAALNDGPAIKANLRIGFYDHTTGVGVRGSMDVDPLTGSTMKISGLPAGSSIRMQGNADVQIAANNTLSISQDNSRGTKTDGMLIADTSSTLSQVLNEGTIDRNSTVTDLTIGYVIEIPTLNDASTSVINDEANNFIYFNGLLNDNTQWGLKQNSTGSIKLYNHSMMSFGGKGFYQTAGAVEVMDSDAVFGIVGSYERFDGGNIMFPGAGYNTLNLGGQTDINTGCTINLLIQTDGQGFGCDCLRAYGLAPSLTINKTGGAGPTVSLTRSTGSNTNLANGNSWDLFKFDNMHLTDNGEQVGIVGPNTDIWTMGWLADGNRGVTFTKGGGGSPSP